MTDKYTGERQPLLRSVSPSPSTSTASSRTPLHGKYPPSPDESSISSSPLQPSRDVEDDVLPESSNLGRTLSWSSCFILVISRVIGSGIFATPGAILQAVGSPGLALLLWVAGAGVAACGLAVSLEFGSMLPRSGGDKVYLEFTYRRPRFLASTMVAVHVVLLGFTASNCVMFSKYVLFAAGREDEGPVLRKGIALALLLIICVVHTVFPTAGVRVQNFLGVFKLAIVGFMILSGLYAIIFQPGSAIPPEARGQLSWERIWDDTTWNWGLISTALFKVFYSFAGLDNHSNVLNEVKDPVRTLRSVALTALVTSCGMYLLVNVAYFLVVPVDRIKASGELIAALFFEQLFGEAVGRRLLPMAVAVSAAGNVFVVAFAMARIKHEIARQGFLPFSKLLSTTKPFGSPIGGFIVHFIPSALVIVLPPSKSIYSFILEVEGYPAQFYTLALAIGLLWLRVKRPDLKRPFKAWLFAPLIRIVLAIALIAAPFFPPTKKPSHGMFFATYAIVGVSILVTGLLYWLIWFRVIPRWRGYRIEEETEVLSDGTSITKLIHSKIEQSGTR